MTRKSRLIAGYIILVIGFVGFIIAVLFGSLLLGLVSLVIGLILWMVVLISGSLYGLTCSIGSVIAIFGVITSVTLFLSIGVEQDIFDAQKICLEGSVFSVLTLSFFTVICFAFYYFGNLEELLDYLRKELERLEGLD